jgi:hypothetical protein
MGVKRRTRRTPQADTGVVRCPACASAEAAIACSTRTCLYLLCPDCDHVWSSRLPPDAVENGQAWTSMAFRITRRTLSRRAN